GTAASARCGANRIAVRKLRAIFRGPLSATILSRKNEVAPATTRCRGRSIYVALSRLLARSTTLALSACLACPVDNMLDNPIKRLLALRVRDAEKRLLRAKDQYEAAAARHEHQNCWRRLRASGRLSLRHSDGEIVVAWTHELDAEKRGPPV